MAAPTNPRVEAVAVDTAIIRWDYAGANTIAVYRSTNGVDYSEITDVTSSRVAVGTTEYEDATLSEGTKYWYKLSDDSGATFSSVVTVWSYGCLVARSTSEVFTLPRFYSIERAEDDLNKAMRKIEELAHNRVLLPNECVACVSDGQIIIDCSEGCEKWVVYVTEDINSIDIRWCDDGPDPVIDLVTPPSTTRKICGWPRGSRFGLFGGDECFQTPVTGGTVGRTNTVGPNKPGTSKPGYGRSSTGGGTGGRGGSTCACTPGSKNELTVKCCTADCSMSCGGAKKLVMKACGGRPPYTWAASGNLVLDKTTGPQVTVTPPTNSGSAVAGDAYYMGKVIHNAGNCSSGCGGTGGGQAYGCNDAATASVVSLDNWGGVGSSLSYTNESPCPPCASCTAKLTTIDFGVINGKPCQSGTEIFDPAKDVRTAPMIAQGCQPCGLEASGETVTVTDAAGVSVVKVLER